VTLQSHGSALPSNDGLSSQIKALAPWFHNIHLPSGRQTAPDHPLGDFPAFKWVELAEYLPQDLSGCRALDIGCNAGFYSFELVKRGAEVTAVDADPHYLVQAHWVAERLGLEGRVDFRQMQVYEIAHLTGSFDLVLFMGVFYHLRYPLLALDLVAQKVKDTLVLQTLTMPGDSVSEVPQDLSFEDRWRFLDEGWPKMAFVERELAGDWTNQWVPNHAAVEALLRAAGFDVVARPGHELYIAKRFPQDDYVRASVMAELQSARGTHSRPD
jgi:tRNA (mo5U34)-methyltransferase